jgi:RNA recognition motif-containing protein
VSTGESNTLFCGNIGFHTTKDDIRAFFHKAGDITSVIIAMGEDGRACGFCLIEFGTPAQAQEAMKLNGQELDGRGVRLDISAKRQERGDHFGREGFCGG